MISLFVYDKKVSKVEFSTQIIRQLLNKKAVLWLDLHNPTKKEHEQIKEVFGIHPLVIEDCSKTHTRPKVEIFPSYNFIVTNGVAYTAEKHLNVSLVEFDFIIRKNFLISNHFGPAHHVDDIMKNPKRLQFTLSKGPDFVLHALIDAEVDNYFPLLDIIEDKLESFEDTIIQDPSPAILKELFIIKKHLLTIRKSASPQREVVSILAKRDYPFISREAEIYFRDIYDHLIRISDMSDNFRDLVSSTVEIHLSVVSNKLNEVMKVLTVIATIMLPLTVITGIYGMNFVHIPELNWEYGYLWALGLMAFIAIIMIANFRRSKWI